ncbi:TonB-dependent receptor [Polaribacter sp. SA4-12]|uniref:TonB-dependent receptor n=1 Tax=Polaribacter sp. SA4-12 TaxID=1312072 RepID=UPI000B3C84E4|nr:TonB-dependent receptor plug domain-containing protein [Polaribacter sp. SA4-12]ARV13674.1 TonB-dependent receptor [Polaribacter sp. SA4-12]
MNKKFIIILLFLSIKFYAQEKEQISIDFNQLTQLEAISLIESKTNYKFFYIDKWFNKETQVSLKFTNSSITKILEALLENTNLNYYILNNVDIILTQNSLIYDSVYQETIESTVSETENISEDKKTAPILISTNNAITNSYIKRIKIGKENNLAKQKNYKLSGTVKNSITGESIANVVLFVRDKNIYTSTDKNGKYTFNLPYGSNIIEPILTGIQKSKTEVIIYGNGTYNFKLNEVSEQLEGFEIESSAKKNIRSTQTGITQIKAEEVKTIPQVLGERDILKIATTLPGIQSAGEGADGVNVRGGKSDQNLFLLDKSVLYNPTHFLGLFSAVNPFTTDNLKVYKGNIPSEFGGRISSVFDITTKDNDAKKFKGEASIGPITSNLSIETPIIKGKSTLLFGVRNTYSNWLLKALNDKKLKNSSASFYDIIAKYKHHINENNVVRISGYYSNDKYSIASDTTNAYGNKILAVDWTHKFNDKNSGNLLLSNSNYSFNIDLDSDSNNNFTLKYVIDEVNLKLKMKYLYSKKHKFDYGIASKLYNVKPGNKDPKGENSIITPISVQKERAIENALFITDNYTINKKLAISLGARYTLFSALGGSTQRTYAANTPKSDASVISVQEYDNNEAYKTYQGLSLRLSSRYAIDDELSIKASFSNLYQFIHRLTNNTSASPTDTWKLSDLNIKPQESLQASLGIYKNVDGNNYEFSLEGYYKAYKNILDYKVGATFLLNEYIETEALQGPGKSYGIEFLARKNKGRLNGWLSYSYSRSYQKLDSDFLEERVNNGNYFPTSYDKPHDLNVIANYKLTKRFSLSANFAYQTGRPITYPTGKYILQGNEYLLYSDRNKFRVPDYFRLDLGLNIEGNHKIKKVGHSFWNISVYNVLGRNNPYAIFFVTENGKVQAYRSSIFSKPIPTITYNFKF